MQDLDTFKSTFFDECDELLSQIERSVAELATSDQPTASLNAAFRAVHSIKGGAGMFGFARLVAFAHTIESALEQARAGRIATNAAFIDAVLHAADVLADLASAARARTPLADDFEMSSRDQLTVLVGVGLRNSNAVQPQTGDGAADGVAAVEAAATYRIRYEPAADIFRRGLEPALMVRALAELGDLDVAADLGKLPDFIAMDPANAYMCWTFTLKTRSPKHAITEIFQFISKACRLEIEAIGAIEAAAPPLQLAPQPAPQPSAPPADVEPWLTPDARAATSIRVELERVERLVDLVGEISIAQSMVLQHLDQEIVDQNPLLFRALTQVLQLSRGLQDGVMAIRAQPIRSIFSRMPRVVRDAAHSTGKKVRLQLRGEDTEIDKTIIEQISDPLMHIVRNAIDHGVEAASHRLAAGKPETGLVTLSAEQRGGRIVVEVSDDGGGIDRAAVRQRAVDLDLISGDVAMTDYDIDNLVFRPGLSTARAVSDLSGRGVGMDVVHQNIQRLGGRVSIRSEPGAGTTTTIVLPLTLAVLEAMLVRSGPESYLMPLANIVECIVADRRDVNHVPGAGDFVAVRGEQIRTLNLAQCLQRSVAPLPARLQILLVEIQSGGVVGLIVDEICGHRQVVIKSIREHFLHIPGLAGATILGDGRVAFILDADEIAAAPAGRNGRPMPPAGANASEEARAA